MNNPAFLSIVHELQTFLGRICIKLSESKLAFVEKAFPGGNKSLENMELAEYLKMFDTNTDGYFDRDQDYCRLFEKHYLPKHVVADIKFIRGFRNKYFHLKGHQALHTNDELADMLVVQRVVKALAEKCEPKMNLRNSRGNLRTLFANSTCSWQRSMVRISAQMVRHAI